MAKLGTSLATIFKKLGIELTDDLKPLTELSNDVPDDIASKLDTGLLTIAAAKSNPEIHRAIKASTLDPFDKKMNEIITEFGLQPDEEFAASQNTYEKFGKLTKLINEAASKKAGSSTKGNAEEWAKKEADYQKQLKDLKDSMTAKEAEFMTTLENRELEFELKTILSGKQYNFPKEMDSKLKLNTAKGAIDLELQSKGYSLKRNQAGQLIIVDKDGQPAYNEKHEAIEPVKFIDGALARNNMLQINDPNQQHQQQQGAGAQVIPGAKGQGNLAVAQEIVSEGYFQ
jgi:hypothetical protein